MQTAPTERLDTTEAGLTAAADHLVGSARTAGAATDPDRRHFRLE